MNISGIATLLAQQVTSGPGANIADKASDAGSFDYSMAWTLLAQAADSGEVGFFENPVVWTLGIILLGIPVTTWIGRVLGSMVRTPDNSWRIGLILWCLVISAVVISTKPLKFGVDLRGGVTIIGQMNEQDLEPGRLRNDRDRFQDSFVEQKRRGVGYSHLSNPN